MSKRKAMKRPARKKRTVRLIAETHPDSKFPEHRTEPYAILAALIHHQRSDLADVKIALAWRYGWRPNPDGLLRMGQCKKRGDLDRELDKFDFVILLNGEAFDKLKYDEKHRLIHHQLTHAQLVYDEDGNVKQDDCNRPVCRIRKHDIEEFRSIVEEYGWKDDLSEIGKAAIADADRPLLTLAGKPKDDLGKPNEVIALKLRTKGLTAALQVFVISSMEWLVLGEVRTPGGLPDVIEECEGQRIETDRHLAIKACRKRLVVWAQAVSKSEDYDPESLAQDLYDAITQVMDQERHRQNRSERRRRNELAYE